MISKHALYYKSAKGTEAIATRAHGLPPKLRPVLILIDGKRSVEELLRLSGMLGDIESLGQLLAEGFIEEVVQTQPATLSATPETEAPLVHPVSLVEARRFAVRQLTDLLGPTSEQLCLRIEAARNTQEFSSAVAHAETVLRDFGGAQMASTFAAAIQSHRPA